MAELATIARPYAEALFEATRVDLNGTAVWLDELAALAGNDQLQQLVVDPRLKMAQILDLITSVVKSSLPDAAKNFLKVVLDNGRFSAIPEIAHQFHILRNAQNGSSDAVIYSALPIEAVQLADLTAPLEKRFGRKLNVRVELDAQLIGGVRIVVGDEVLDASVKSRLEQMKLALTA